MGQFSLRVDPASGEPLFAQIVAAVKQAVATGRLGAGDRLPSVRELARELVINPNTIAKAYQALDAEGITLYRFEMDTDGSSTCYDDCESSWPPLVVDDPTAGGEADQGLLGTTERDDGTVQVTYDDQPLYYFSGDSAPGDTKGQNLGKVWFVVAPDGDAIETKGAGSEDDGGMTDDDDMTDDDMTDDGSGEDDNGYDR